MSDLTDSPACLKPGASILQENIIQSRAARSDHFDLNRQFSHQLGQQAAVV
jgi:hypothetical protein